MPDGFPEDIPMPDFTSVKVIKAPVENNDFWSVVLVLPSATDPTQPNTAVEDYAEQLADAGYALEDGPAGGQEATGPAWQLSFHSVAAGTLTLIVLPA